MEDNPPKLYCRVLQLWPPWAILKGTRPTFFKAGDAAHEHDPNK
jgi:hypothetical protein